MRLFNHSKRSHQNAFSALFVINKNNMNNKAKTFSHHTHRACVRKIPATVFIVLSLVFILTACGAKETKPVQTLQERVDARIDAYCTDLSDSAETLTDQSKIHDYLTQWAKMKNIDFDEDDAGNVIFKRQSSEAYAKAPATTVVCPFCADTLSSSIETIAAGLYIAKNNEDTGNLFVVFTPEDEGRFPGLETISDLYFPAGAYVFCLSAGEHAQWTFNSGALGKYSFTGSVTQTKPANDTACHISIRGLPGGSPDEEISAYPNPLKTLGSLLGSFKTGAHIFEIASIDGGLRAFTYPTGAEMTIVYNNKDAEKFNTRLDQAIKKFNKQYRGRYPDALFTYEQTELPAAVFSSESQNALISGLYILNDGVFAIEKEGQINGFTNIGALHAADGKYTIEAIGEGKSEDILADIEQDYATAASLAGVGFSGLQTGASWNADTKSSSYKDFKSQLGSAYKTYNKETLHFETGITYTPASVVGTRFPEVLTVNTVLNGQVTKSATGTIVQFLINQGNEKK